ncbi:hypothetical protein Q6249_28105, partial [Klebsiella pneumoniae]|nr:hypothetical protein [Klebsiella pneumoniae]
MATQGIILTSLGYLLGKTPVFLKYEDQSVNISFKTFTRALAFDAQVVILDEPTAAARRYRCRQRTGGVYGETASADAPRSSLLSRCSVLSA